MVGLPMKSCLESRCGFQTLTIQAQAILQDLKDFHDEQNNELEKLSATGEVKVQAATPGWIPKIRHLVREKIVGKKSSAHL